MKTTSLILLSTVVVLLVLQTVAASAAALGTAFTYQGRLTAGGSPANGNYDLQFDLFTTSAGGAPTATATRLNVAVTGGVFTTTVDFGAGVFAGTAYWLEISARTNGGGAYTTLTPRQELTPSPYAIYAAGAAIADGAVTSAKILDGTVVGADLAANTVTSTQLADSIDLGSTSVSGALNVYRTAANTPGVTLTGSGSQISTFGSDGLEQIRLWGPSWGELLLNDFTGNDTTVKLSANSDGGGSLHLYHTNNSARVLLSSSATTGAILLYTTNGSLRASLSGNSTGSLLTMYQADGGTGVLVDGDSNGAGLINIYNTNSSLRVVLDGQSTGAGGEISVRDADGTETIEILGAEDVNTGGQILMRNAGGINTIQLDSDANGNGCGYIRLYKANGTATITLEADTGGDGRITTQELQITGGSDLSEQFDINAASAEVQPGMVVCIDPQRPGELVMSTRAYDRTVAGVVSGAGGVKPGMLMGQRGTAADGKHPVALTGRVFCLADATKGAIQRGDLLTTSSTPGHAMKVLNHSKAQGAIIGKAMTSLEQGRGLVLVLVSLQ